MNTCPKLPPASTGLLGRVRLVLVQWRWGSLTTRQVIRIAMRLVRFEQWGVRTITQSRFRALNQAAEQAEARLTFLESSRQEALDEQRAAVEMARRIAARNNTLTANLEQTSRTVEHLRRVEAAYATLSDAHEEVVSALNTARRGVQAMINEWQRLLFALTDNTVPSEAATTLVLADRPVADSMATLINLSEASHGARQFQLAVPILAVARPFPLQWPADLPPLRIIDVGSQELESESDMHAPLRAVAPVEIIGFDPFVTSAELDGGIAATTSVEVTRRDGSRVRTFPTLLADGKTVTFHINRYDATSSMLPSNHDITKQFGLLDLAVETVETRTLLSHRMDDVLPVEGDTARIDLLKIDVQGAAHLVLENATKVLRNTLVCHIEIEFAPVYLGEKLFGDVDILLRAAGFCFVDFFSLGRQRYGSFESAPTRAFHRGRTLWADCIYIRGLDTEGAISADDLFRAAVIAHSCYNKQDLAAELLRRLDIMTGTGLLEEYISGGGMATRMGTG